MDQKTRILVLVTFVMLYVFGRSAQGNQVGRSPIFVAPGWLSTLCLRPLAANRPEFVPTVAQMAGLIGIVVSVPMTLGFFSDRVAASIAYAIHIGWAVIISVYAIANRSHE